MNNPLSGTDPSGYSSKCSGTRIGSDDGSMCGGGNKAQKNAKLPAKTNQDNGAKQQQTSEPDTNQQKQTDLENQQQNNASSNQREEERKDPQPANDGTERITITCDSSCQENAKSMSSSPTVVWPVLFMGNKVGELVVPRWLNLFFRQNMLIVAAMIPGSTPREYTVNMRGASESTGGDPDEKSDGKFTTDKEAAEQAKKLGFKKISERSHGQAVYRKGNRYITRDVDSHSGGAWKMANSVRNLRSKSTRMGTYSRDLKKIGD